MVPVGCADVRGGFGGTVYWVAACCSFNPIHTCLVIMLSCEHSGVAPPHHHHLITNIMPPWWCNAGYFFVYYLVNIVFTMNAAAIFRLTAYIAPDGVSANAYGGLVLMVFIVLSGFAIVRSECTPWC